MKDSTPEEKARLELLAGHVLEYLDTRWDLIMLTLTEKALAAISNLVTGLMWALFGGIALLFACIGWAIWLGERLGNPAAGFFIVAGVFLLLLVIVLIFARTYIRTVVTDAVLKSIQDDDENE